MIRKEFVVIVMKGFFLLLLTIYLIIAVQHAILKALLAAHPVRLIIIIMKKVLYKNAIRHVLLVPGLIIK